MVSSISETMDKVSYNERPRKLELEHLLFPAAFAEDFVLHWIEEKGRPNHKDI